MESKKIEKKINRVLLGMAVVSLIFTLSYGLQYYIDTIQDPLLLIFAVIQNSVDAFAFRSSISFATLAENIHASTSIASKLFGYCYGIACFTAPYCTLSFFYTILSHLFQMRFSFRGKKGRHGVVIFGYNTLVKNIFRIGLDKGLKKDPFLDHYRIHLVTSEEIPASEKAVLDTKGILIHNDNFKELLYDKKEMARFLKDVEIGKAEKVLLFEESASFNFSAYHYLTSEKNEKPILPENAKIFLNCEDEGIARIIEEEHDNLVKAGKKAPDLELFDLAELRVQDLLEKHPLHSVYLSQEKDPNEWDLHLLLIGFDKLGEQLALQALNMGVAGSRNRILIDVLDPEAGQKRKSFASRFHEGYVRMEEGTLSIDSDKADGECRIRFTKANVRHVAFMQKLKNCAQDGPFTYAAVLMDDTDDTFYCQSQLQRFFRQNPKLSAGRLPLIVQLDHDMGLQAFAEECSDPSAEVIALKPAVKTIELKDFLAGDLDLTAKAFNHSYCMFQICASDQAASSGQMPAAVSAEEEKKAADEEWRNLTLFKRNANRAIAMHAPVHAEIMKRRGATKEVLNTYFGENGSLLKKYGNAWTYEGSAEAFALKQSDMENYPLPSELSRMEHRRWCYYTAACGWGCTEDKTAGKNQVKLENPCMCTWNDLEKYQPGYCVYDLMPTLYEMGR